MNSEILSVPLSLFSCRPPSATAVFAGVDASGSPVWHDLRDTPPSARFHSIRDLQWEMQNLPGPGDPACRILGQVTAGPWTLPPAFAAQAGSGRLALTTQVILTDSPASLEVQTWTGGLLPDEWLDLLQEPGFEDLARAMAALHHAVEDMQEEIQRVQTVDRILLAVPGLLRNLATALAEDLAFEHP